MTWDDVFSTLNDLGTNGIVLGSGVTRRLGPAVIAETARMSRFLSSIGAAPPSYVLPREDGAAIRLEWSTSGPPSKGLLIVAPNPPSCRIKWDEEPAT